MSHRIYNTDAFVVGVEATSEASAYLRLWTRELGLLGAWCQGVRQMRSKLRHHTTILSHLQVSLVRGRDIWRVTGADTQERAQLEGRELKRVAHKLLSSAWRIIPREEADALLFDRMRDSFLLVGARSAQVSELEGLELSLMLELLDRAGYLKEDFNAYRHLSLLEPESLLKVHKEKSRLVPVINEALFASQL